MKKLLIPVLGLMITLSSCEMLDNSTGLSDADIIDGLKTALNVGADSASGNLARLNGYYSNPLVKIPLPAEAEAVRNLINSNSALSTISSTIGLDAKFEDVIKTVNRAAESAASEAAPIFKDAITNLSITDGLSILQGTVPGESATKSGGFDSTAATQYLKLQTYAKLTALYAPKINTALGQDMIGNVSAVEAWQSLTSTYNTFVGSYAFAIQLAGVNLPSSINSDLGAFCTQKALDGLFYKVGIEEKKIRKNPLEWATTAVGDILGKVFGSVN